MVLSARGFSRPYLAVAGSLIAGFIAGALAWALIGPRIAPVEAAQPLAVGAAGWGGMPTAAPTPLRDAAPPDVFPPPTPTPIAIPHTPYLLALAGATPLRAGPGVEFETLRRTAAFEGFVMLGASADGGWWAVRLPGVPGNMAWIDRRAALAYLTVGLPVFPALERVDLYPIPGERHLMIVADTAALRSGPGLIFAALQKARRGDWFLLAGSSRDGKWLAVSIDGVSGRLGWVRAAAAETY